MKERIEKRIQQGCVLAFDTNALWGPTRLSRLIKLCNLVNVLSSKPPRPAFQLVVPAVVHGEHVLHIRHERMQNGSSFDIQVIWDGLKDKNLIVIPFDAGDAEAVAEYIALRYPDRLSWREAKRNLAIKKLGLSSVKTSEAPGKKLPATVDWLIAGQAKNNNWILVTDDQGVEFEGLERIDLESLETLLSTLLTSAAEAAG